MLIVEFPELDSGVETSSLVLGIALCFTRFENEARLQDNQLRIPRSCPPWACLDLSLTSGEPLICLNRR
jgi:hypothetical protein